MEMTNQLGPFEANFIGGKVMCGTIGCGAVIGYGGGEKLCWEGNNRDRCGMYNRARVEINCE